MLRTCPHCGQSGIVDTQPLTKLSALSAMWAFASCHSCQGRYTVVRAGGAEKLPELLIPAQRSNRTTLPQLLGKIRFGLNLVAAGAVATILIAAPAVFLLSRSHHGGAVATDRVKTSLAAPIAAPIGASASPESNSLMVAHVDPASAILRAGPGAQYRRLGSVGQGIELPVQAVLSNWVQITPPREIAAAEPAPAHGFWIRRDLVQIRTPREEATR